MAEWQCEFETRDMEFLYLHQENGGQASAINRGLPYVTGEYFMWLDCDDFLEKDHVEKKVRYLEEHEDVELVMCRGNIFTEDDLTHPTGILGGEKPVGTLFEDILFSYRACQCGLYMVRARILFQVISDRGIYDSRAGQNMQLLLPITIRNHNGYITDKLYNYVVRENSHSHLFKSSSQWKQRLDQLEDLKKHMLQEIPMDVDYREHLIHILDIQIIAMRIGQLDELIEEQNPAYVKHVCERYVEYAEMIRRCAGRKIYFWGACRTTEKISRLLETFAGIRTEKIIESDFAKTGSLYEGKAIISREEINTEKMYIIIPLNYHQELVDFLQSKGFQSMRDYFYPQYEIRRLIMDWKHN